MKWKRLLVLIVVEVFKAIRRGWNDGRADVKNARMQADFDRANSGEEIPLDKRSAKS